MSLRDCDICQQFVPRPKLFVKRVITFASASKNFQLKKRTFAVFFFIVFLFLPVSGLWSWYRMSWSVSIWLDMEFFCVFNDSQTLRRASFELSTQHVSHDVKPSVKRTIWLGYPSSIYIAGSKPLIPKFTSAHSLDPQDNFKVQKHFEPFFSSNNFAEPRNSLNAR